MLRPYCQAEGFFGLFQVAEEVGFGVEQKRTVCEVMIGDFVSGGFDAGDQVGVAGARSPIRKNVAWALCWCRISRTCGVKMGCGPSSKERATRGWLVRMR